MAGITRIDICCNPKLLDNHWYRIQVEAAEETIITAEMHGLGKIPFVSLYDLAGDEIEAEVKVNELTWEVRISQEGPAIPLIIVMN